MIGDPVDLVKECMVPVSDPELMMPAIYADAYWFDPGHFSTHHREILWTVIKIFRIFPIFFTALNIIRPIIIAGERESELYS